MQVQADDALILLLPWVALVAARVLWALFVARSARSLAGALQFRLSTMLAIMAFIPATFVLTNALNFYVTADHGDGLIRRFRIGLPASAIVAGLTPIVWLVWQLTEDWRQPHPPRPNDQEPSFQDWKEEGAQAADFPATGHPAASPESREESAKTSIPGSDASEE